MKLRLPSSLLKALLCVFATGFASSSFSVANAVTEGISINFNSGGSFSDTASYGAANFKVLGSSWNKYTSPSGSSSNLINQNGSSTGINLTYSSANNYAGGASGNPVMDRYLDDGSGGPSITLSNIGYFTYDLIILAGRDGVGTAGSAFSSKIVNGVSYTANTSDVNGSAVTGNAVWGSGNVSAETANTNYLRVAGLSAYSTTIKMGTNSNGSRGSIGGLQLINTYAGKEVTANLSASPSSSWTSSLLGDADWTDGTGNAARIIGSSSGTTLSIADGETRTLDALSLESGNLTISGGNLALVGLGILQNLNEGSTLTLDSNVTGINSIRNNGTIAFDEDLSIDGAIVSGAGTFDMQGHAFTWTTDNWITQNITNASSVTTQGTLIRVDRTAKVTGNDQIDLSDYGTSKDIVLKAQGDTSVSGGSSTLKPSLAVATGFNKNIEIQQGLITVSEAATDLQQATLVLNGGGLLFATGGKTTLDNNIVIGTNGGIFRNYGTVTGTYTGSVSGSGIISRSDGGIVIFTGDFSGYTGTLNANTGTTRFANSADNSINSITLGTVNLNGGTLNLQRTTNTITSLVSQSSTSTLESTAGTTIDITNYTASAGTANFTGTGTTTVSGLFSVANGTVNVSSGNLNVNQLRLSDGGFDRISNFSLSGGTLTITGTNNTANTTASILLAHWGNSSNPLAGKTTFNISGGTFEASGATVFMNWDGSSTMNISGGLTNVLGFQFRGTTHGQSIASSINITGGRVNIGTTGIVNTPTGATENVKFGNAVIGALDSWSSNTTIYLTDTTGTTINTENAKTAGTGQTITLSGDIKDSSSLASGGGSLIKDGLGTLVLSGRNTYTGATTLKSGTLDVRTGFLATSSVNVQGGELKMSSSTLTNSDARITLGNNSSLYWVGNTTLFNTFVSDKISSIGNNVGLSISLIARTSGNTEPLISDDRFTLQGLIVSDRYVSTGSYLLDDSARSSLSFYNVDGTLAGTLNAGTGTLNVGSATLSLSNTDGKTYITSTLSLASGYEEISWNSAWDHKVLPSYAKTAQVNANTYFSTSATEYTFTDINGKLSTAVKVLGSDSKVNIYGGAGTSGQGGGRNIVGDVYMSVEGGTFGTIGGGSSNVWGQGTNYSLIGNLFLQVKGNVTADYIIGGMASTNGSGQGVNGDVNLFIGQGVQVINDVVGYSRLSNSDTPNNRGNVNMTIESVLTGNGRITLGTDKWTNVTGNLSSWGNLSLTVNVAGQSGTFGKAIYGGSFSGSPAPTGTVTGNSSVTLNADTGTTFSNIIVGNNATTTGATLSFVGNSTVTLNGGTYSNKVVGAGYSTAASGVLTMTGNTLIQINGGSYNDNLIAGGYTTNATATSSVTGNTSLVLNGGSFGGIGIHGGGLTTATGSDVSVSGISSVTLTGAIQSINNSAAVNAGNGATGSVVTLKDVTAGSALANYTGTINAGTATGTGVTHTLVLDNVNATLGANFAGTYTNLIVKGTTSGTTTINKLVGSTISIESGRTLNIAVNGADQSYANAVAFTGNLEKSGSNKLALNGVVSGSGNIKVSSGALELNNVANTFTGGISATGAGTVLRANQNWNSTATYFGTGAVTLGAGTRLEFSATSYLDNAGSTVANNFVFEGATLAALGRGQTFNGTFSLTGSNNVYGTNVNNTGIVLNNIISGSGSLVIGKDGDTTYANTKVTLKGNNTFSGGTTLEAGTLVLGHANALGAGDLTLNGGSLVISSTTNIGGDLNINNAGLLTLNLELGTSGIGSSLALGGTMNYGLDFTNKVGLNITFSEDISANDSWTLISSTGMSHNGTSFDTSTDMSSYFNLAFTDFDSSLFSYTLKLDASGNLVLSILNAPNDLAWKGDSDTGSGTWGGNSTDWNGDSSYTDNSEVSFGDVVVATPDTPASISIEGNVAPSMVVVDSESTNYVFTGTGSIAGGTSLVKEGASTLTIETKNSYTGETLVRGGELVTNSENALGTGDVTVENGAKLTNTGTGILDNDITVDTGSIVRNDGAIKGKITVNSGASLQGEGQFEGAVEVLQGGTLIVGNSPGNPVYTDLTLNAGSTTVFTIDADATGGATYGGILGTNYSSMTVTDSFTMGSMTITLDLTSDFLTQVSDAMTAGNTSWIENYATLDLIVFSASDLSQIIIGGYDLANMNQSKLDLINGSLATLITTKFDFHNDPKFDYATVVYSLVDKTGGNYALQAQLSIPEPSTATLGLVALAGLLLRRRRKQA